MAAKVKETEGINAEGMDFDSPITTVDKPKEEGPKWPMVRIFLPPPENASESSKVDMYEHVTIANEKGQKIWYVLRGEWTEVPVPVFVNLKEKYPNL